MFRTSILIATVLVATGSAVAAEPRREPIEVHVSAMVNYRDPQQVRALHAQLERAARAACDSNLGRDLAAAQGDNRCVHDSLDRAVASLNQPMLTAIHEGRPLDVAVMLAAANR